jgi:Zn-dependent protease
MDLTLAGVTAILGYVVFLLCTMIHEAGHALAARWLGLGDVYPLKRARWNPFAHMEKSRFGLGVIPLISMFANMRIAGVWTFGYSAAPFDPEWAVKNRAHAAWIAAAGPAANFLCALAMAALIRMGVAGGLFAYDYSATHWLLVKSTVPAADALAALASLVLYQNVLMATFSLIPMPPLDGFAICLLWLKPERVLALYRWENKLSFLYPIAVFHATAVFWSLMSRTYVYFLAVLF